MGACTLRAAARQMCLHCQLRRARARGAHGPHAAAAQSPCLTRPSLASASAQEPARRPAGAAGQTALGAYAPVVAGRPAPAAGGVALVLQLPAEGPLAAGGVAGVLRRPPCAGAAWLGSGAGREFFFPTAACARADGPEARPGRALGGLLLCPVGGRAQAMGVCLLLPAARRPKGRRRAPGRRRAACSTPVPVRRAGACLGAGMHVSGACHRSGGNSKMMCRWMYGC